MIILDTHTLVWWVTVPAKLSRGAREIIEASNENKQSLRSSSLRTAGLKQSFSANKQSFSANKQSFSANKQSFSANKEQILVSSISIWEICLLVKSKELKFSVDINTWINKVERLPNLEFIPVNNSIFAKSVMLPEPFHKDPADRIIVATARELGAVLVTSDRRLLEYKYVQSLW